MPQAPDLAYACRLPPQDAIAYLESKGYAIGFSWTDVWQEAHAKAFTAAGVMKVDVLADLKGGLVDALQNGTTRQDYLRNVTPLLQRKGWWGADAQVDEITGEMAGKGLTPRRLATIFDTNLQSAYMAGRYKAFLANVADRPYWQYVAVMDSRTRPAHAALNGRTFRYDDPFWQSGFPPNGFRCFPPETLLRADAEIGLKTWYAGEMVEFETGLGKKLTVTANHPILTGRGRLPAHAIEEGEQVLSDAGIVDARVPGVVDHRQPPASAEDLFEALKPQGFRIVPMATNDFHGDALLRKPEIHVAGPDRVLMDEIELEAQQFSGQRHFRQTHGGASGHANLAGRPPLAGSILVNAMLAQESADVAEAGIQALGDGSLRGHAGTVKGEHAALDVGVNAVRGGPCRTELAAKGGGIALDRLPFEDFGFASAAQGNAVASENAPECGTTEAQLIRELLEAHSGLIALDQVVRVRKFDWAGHVFDFQTATGLMFAAGIVVYNCRCGVRALDREDLQARGIDLSSSEGRLSEIEVPTSRQPDGPTATVTRFEYAPGKFFAPDAGWNYNPGQSGLAHLRQILTEQANRAEPALARASVQAQVGSPAFSHWFDHPDGDFPIAVLDRESAARIGAQGQVAVFSAASHAKQALRHPELTASDYVRVQEVIDRGTAYQDSAVSLVFVLDEPDGLTSVVKATQSGEGLFLTSLRHLSANEAQRAAEIRRIQRKADGYAP